MSETSTAVTCQVSRFSASFNSFLNSIIQVFDIIVFDLCQVSETFFDKTVEEPQGSFGTVGHDSRSLHLNCSFSMVEVYCHFTNLMLPTASNSNMKDTVEFCSVTVLVVVDMIAVDGDIIEI